VLTRPEADRATLIGRLSLRTDAEWLAELLIDLEEDELARLRLIEACGRSRDTRPCRLRLQLDEHAPGASRGRAPVTPGCPRRTYRDRGSGIARPGARSSSSKK
jgi:hypothetical protein